MENYFNPELSNKFKLNGSNYIDRKQRMCSLLLIKGYYDIVINFKSPEKAAEKLKVDPYMRLIAYDIISLNCDIKVASKFNQKCDFNPYLLWELLEKHYLPKALQNQASYLGNIFSTFLSESNLQSVERVQELTQNL
ncbi:hypothetical protein O181_095002 [Austropuccinia psidii MF-1]|uniref:Uncharacterized protein n=1 Tax=Austropuccinia psidii MF-1 TaxID=1389203 RepID=A0A9Q3J4I2_9BASI|nr:hypothetical protein [Austropuccinia psidii MF-1]